MTHDAAPEPQTLIAALLGPAGIRIAEQFSR